MRKLALILVLFTIPFLLFSATGKIAGKITRSDNGKPVEDVAVFIEGGESGVYTKANGTFIIENVDAGTYTVHAQHISFMKKTAEVIVKAGETSVQNFIVEVKSIEISGVTVSANRAKSRETPVAFTDVNAEELADKYTTGDIPELLDDIPGLFSTTSGLGEAEITMRGFDAEKIQILVNGIPVNDPESQVVYWSNWTGLTSNAKTVQVQRGAGASLYGSGAFGGSVNIETMGSSSSRELTIRSSGGYYLTDGKSATAEGKMEEYHPMNYNTLLKYSSGKLYDGNFKFDVTAERKAGDYYIRGTEYDGWSFGFETENKLKNHVINTSLIFAPQKHNQARSTYDREMGKFLGREFNYTNHKWQENTYSKPQFSIRDRWAFSPKTYLMTNLFATMGNGGGSYANNIIFNPENGELLYKNLEAEGAERRRFAQYAYFLHEQGYDIDGFEYNEATTGGTLTWAGASKTVYSGADVFTGDIYHTSKMKSYNNHKQLGLNTYLNKDITDNVNVVVGAEGRYWEADHYKESTNFRYYNPEEPDSLGIFDTFVREYDYTTKVINSSAFARAKLNIPFESGIQSINFMLDGQYAIYYSEVDENLIHYFDPIKGEIMDGGYYATKDNFDKDDYNRTYDFFSPKFGTNVNLNDNWNVLANYSIVYKEPKVGDWYDRSDGPGANQVVDGKTFELNPEKGNTIEGGVGYNKGKFKADVNYYYTNFTDKIESITDEHGDSKTINAGKATHQGVELSFSHRIGDFDMNGSTTLSQNRWGDLNLEKIFYEDAEDVEGKVVPFSPEQMANAGLGYTFQNMPLDGNLRLGLTAKWSDEMYSTYDNLVCKQLYYYDDDGVFQSMGEHEFVDNPEGEGHYAYNEETGEYVISQSGGIYNGDFDREWIMSSSKLPAYFQLNYSMSYKFMIGSHDTSIKLSMNNILNKDDNFSKASITKAYGMALQRVDEDGNVEWDDPTFGEGASGGNSDGTAYYPYLSPSPLFNIFLTVEYKF